MTYLEGFAKGSMANPIRSQRGPRSVSAPLRATVRADGAFRALFDSSAEALVVLDSRGVIQSANKPARELLRLRDANLRRTNLGEFLPRAIAKELMLPRGRQTAQPRAFKASLASGLPLRVTLRAILPRTHHLLLHFEGLSIAPRRETTSRAEGSLGLSSGIDGEQRIRSKMLQTEKMAALGQLVSGIAHELNNPLTAIMGNAQLLLGRDLPPSQLSEARSVYQEAERARRIVKNLLYFARKNTPERTRVDLNELVERTVALRSYELKLENIVVEQDLAPDLPQTMADPYQLQQVILNLLVNAEQAVLEGRGSGHVGIRTSHRVQKSPHGPRGRLLLEISDDGHGIAPEIGSRIFDPFFTTKAPGVGTGLGLSIAYGIVHEHGGEITFESELGRGTKFIVELPVVAVPATKATPPSGPSVQRTPAARAGRILVVEDEPSVARLIVDVLREEGHRADAVLDSQEGLTRLARERYDLVICDLRMPRLDGAAFYDALVRAGSPMRKKILFTTGDTLGTNSLEFLQSKRLPYLAKPFLVEELKLAVDHLLQSAPGEAADSGRFKRGRRRATKAKA